MITDKPPLDEDLLVHYGVRGMKWGVRKVRPTSNKATHYSIDSEGRISIPKGYQIQRVFDSKIGASSGVSGANYFSFTEKDKNIYVTMMGAGVESRFSIIRKLASDKVSTMVAVEPLRSPSRKEAFEILQKTIDQVGPSKGIKPFTKDFSNKNAEMWYREANAKIVLDKTSQTKQAYFDNLRKAGFNMLVDELDVGRIAEAPIIVLSGEKSLRMLSISDLKGQDVTKAKDFLKSHGGSTIRDLKTLQSREEVNGG